MYDSILGGTGASQAYTSMTNTLAVGIGLVFFIGVFAIIILRGREWKTAFYSYTALVVLLTVLLGTPLVFSSLKQGINFGSTAGPETKILKLDYVHLTPASVQVNLEVSTPVAAYLEYKNLDTGLTLNILSIYGGVSRTDHVFKIFNVGPAGGEAKAVLNGKVTLVNGAALEIR